MARSRADVALVSRGLFASREQARAAILAGEVSIGGVRIEKAGQPVADDAQFTVAERKRFVSRGGLKLEGALDAFGVDVTGMSAVDVGASTGGFTDCLLQRGAAHVAAIDVGYGQLAWTLRNDPRVSVYERTNVRGVDPAAVGGPFELLVVDVSFISLAVVLPKLLELLTGDGQLVALVKPQFEVGKGRVGKRGVVRESSAHAEVLERAIENVRVAGLVVRGLTYSPITGPEGNIEFWLWASKQGEDAQPDVDAVVLAAHENHGG